MDRIELYLITIIALLAVIIWQHFRNEKRVKANGIAADFWAKYSPLLLLASATFAGVDFFFFDLEHADLVLISEKVALIIAALEAIWAVVKKKIQ